MVVFSDVVRASVTHFIGGEFKYNRIVKAKILFVNRILLPQMFSPFAAQKRIHPFCVLPNLGVTDTTRLK